MTTLDQEQDVVDLAKKLRLTGSPVAAIINFCQDRIEAWIREAGGVTSVSELEAVVADRLNLVFEEVNDESDFDRLKANYVPKGEIIFAALSIDLTNDTYGTMIRLKDGTYVAVIDCRGDKSARRFFSRWHEIAHLLVDKDIEHQVFRSSDEPLERLVDQIAGQIGFYDPIFLPILKCHISDGDLLTFETIDAVRKSFCSHASFQATLFACQRRLSTPMLYLEARMEYTEGERRDRKQRRMVDFGEPEKKLRVRLAVPNQAASDMGLIARWNMRVPETSVIYSVFHEDLTDSSGEEDLNKWTFSSGGYLMDCEVFVQARKLDGLVIATIQPK